MHKLSIHEGVKYSFYQCDHKTAQQGHLKEHMLRVHRNKSSSVFSVTIKPRKKELDLEREEFNTQMID